MKVIAVTGGSASGKTTFAKLLSEKIPNSILLSQDNYHLDVSHLTNDELSVYNFDHPEAINLPLLVKNIKTLKEEGEVKIPFYDFPTAKVHDEHIHMEKPDVLIVEGLFSLHLEEMREIADLSLFVHVDSDVRLARRILRDTVERGNSMEDVINRYLDFVKVGHDSFVEPQKEYAHQIINESNFNDKIDEISELFSKKKKKKNKSKVLKNH